MILEHIRYLKEIAAHEMNAGRRARAMYEYFAWNIGRRLLSGADYAVEVLNGCRVILSNEENYATLAYTCRLYDFYDMLFMLHMLGPNDEFVDCGSNVGIYSVLAGSRGVRVLAVEPIPATFAKLQRNLMLNAVRCSPVNCGLGESAGFLRFTTHMGGKNRVALDVDPQGGVEVPVIRLDTLAEREEFKPILAKVDVEGFEYQVFKGAGNLLTDTLKALIVELNGSGNAFGYSDTAVDALLRESGFVSCDYNPWDRQLREQKLADRAAHRLNVIYVRDCELDQVREKLRVAPVVCTRIGAI